jgi:hypothetical protein
MLSVLLWLAVAQVPSRISLEVGESRRVKVPGLQRIAVSGGEIYDLKPVGGDQVEFVGHSPGRSRVLMWRSRGDLIAVELVVVPATPKSKPIPVPVTHTDEQVSVNGQLRQATVFTFPESLAQITSATEADGGVILKGLTTSGERLEIFVTPR